jgi:uncharacterized protein (TIGR00255 family)
MTGFGKAKIEYEGRKIIVEIKSLNSKQLDIITRIPNTYRKKELEIRNMIQMALERGKIELNIVADTLNSATNMLNAQAIKAYFYEIAEIAKSLKIAMPSDWLSVTMHQIEITKTDTSEVDEQEWVAIRAGIEQALDSLNEFRSQEGSMLESVFREKIANIRNLIIEAEHHESDRLERLKSRINDNLQKSDLKEQFDRNRFEQELFFYIERLDVSEEKSRLTNHLKYFIETIESEKSQGRKLGFIAQEIGREINTLGSKSNHAEMQKIVIKMKDELEQIKEQVLNAL